MTRKFLPLLLLLGVATIQASPPFAHEGSDLKPDPAARFGRLENGFRYVIHPNREPKGRASLRLLVLAGSLHEEDDQRGLAHFLEHMAFNGSRHYAPGTLVQFFQRMGMSMGGDTNANTSFDRTLYLIELPDTRSETLAEGFRVLGDYAGGLLLRPDEIEKERGIILSEKRARDDVGFRSFEARFKFMLGATRLPSRGPIGEPDIIARAPRERFVDFWDTWYRPERMIAVVAGDVDAAAVEPLLAATFAPLKPRAPARPEHANGSIPVFEGVRAGFHEEPEAPATTVWFTTMAPLAMEPDTAASRLRRLPCWLAVSMVNRRMSVLARKEGAPFSRASVSVENRFNFLREASLELVCRPGQWPEALALGEQELRRAFEHGFLPEELQESTVNFTNYLEQAVRTAVTRRSGAIADEIAQSVLDQEVFTSPAADLALLQPALARVTPAECRAALREAFAANGRYVMVVGNARITGDPVGAINAAYAASQAVSVAAPAGEAKSAWAYADFGPAGDVVRREEVADLGFTLVTFANGVRLNLKRTDFETGRLRLSARVGYGLLVEPPDQRGLASFASGVFDGGGLERHGVDELPRIMAGRNVGLRFQVAHDALTFTGGASSGDLLLGLQLLAAKLSHPGYREEGVRQMADNLEQMFLSFAHTPNGPLATQVASLIAGGDARFGVPPKDLMLARTMDEVKAWLSPQLSRGPIELALVGDFEVEAAIAAVSRTLGALPPRESRVRHEDLRRVSFPSEPFSRKYAISSDIPRGTLVVYWPTTDASDISRLRRLTLLGQVLGDRLRMKVREELGGTYSPSVRSTNSDTFTGYGYFGATLDVDPVMAANLAEVVVALGDELAKNGVTPEELERARRPVLTSVRESLRSNEYWISRVAARAQENPEILNGERSRVADIESVTAKELSVLAAEYLCRERASRVTILPAAPGAGPSNMP